MPLTASRPFGRHRSRPGHPTAPRRLARLPLASGVLLTAVVAGTGIFVAPLMPTAAGVGTTITVGNQVELTNAVAAAKPGEVIAVKAGTYSGGIDIRTTGTAAAPITLKPAGTGTVVLTKSLKLPSCGASAPATNRTIGISKGASYWTIEGLTIKGGISINGDGAAYARDMLKRLIASHDWKARRAVPGRGVNDPVAARGALDYIGKLLGVTLKASDGIKIINNVISLEGIHSSMNRYGTISGNTISDIACGTGPGVWLGNYSDGWTITNNNVSRVAASTYSHYMQEGIRVGNASDYNHIVSNSVTDLAAGGRAFTTDQDGSYNMFSNNVADGVDIGYNDEMSGWANTWSYDKVTSYRVAGFSFRAKDGTLTAPSMDTSTYRVVVRCNTASGQGRAMQAGALKESTFRSNSFSTVWLSKNLRSYWTSQNNAWNGSTAVPSETPPLSLSGC